MSKWSPDVATVHQLAVILDQSTSASQSARQQAKQALDEAKHNPHLNNYLLYLLITRVDGVVESTRASAGLWLKNNLLHDWSELPAEVLEYLKSNILTGLTSGEKMIRNISGIVLTTLFSKLGVQNWPDLVVKLVHLLDSKEATPETQDGTMSALAKICEDSADALDRDVTGNGERPARILIPKLIELCSSSDPRIRSLAVFCLSQFIHQQSQDFLAHIDVFLEALFTLANDPFPDTRRNIASAFSLLLEVRPDKLGPYLEGVVTYCLHCVQDSDETVALEGAEFFLALAESVLIEPEVIEPLLPPVVPVLLTTMVYSEMDMFLLDNLNENDENVQDRAEDIRPVHNKTKEGHTVKTKHGDEPKQHGNDDDDDEDEDETNPEDSLADWNLRKCSAAALDAFAMEHAPTVLRVAQPYLLDRVNAPEWSVRESAVLAFGAIASGCLKFGVVDFVPELIPYLVKLLHDDHAQIREISCWTLGRYGEPAVAVDDIFTSVFQSLMQCSLDRNKKVQQAGCTAITVIADLAGTKLTPYIEPLLYHFQQCFAKYQQKNMIVLYDCIQTCVNAVAYAIAEPHYMDLLMEPLARRWHEHGDDIELLPLLECLSIVAAFAGSAFNPYAPTVFELSVNTIKRTLMLKERYQVDPNSTEEPNPDYTVCGLDMIDVLVQNLQEGIQPLFDAHRDPSVMDIIQVCFGDESPEVRQSAFGIIGDLTIHLFGEVQPRVESVISSLIVNIEDSGPRTEAVCNNAIWALGELALIIDRNIEPYFNELFQRVGTVLMQSSAGPLMQNAAITIGRLGMSVHDLIAPHLRSLIERWLTVMAEVEETNEKDTSYQGICRTIGDNPGALSEQQLLVLFTSFASYQAPSIELREAIATLLLGYKTFLSNFGSLLTKLDPDVKTQLQAVYGLQA